MYVDQGDGGAPAQNLVTSDDRRRHPGGGGSSEKTSSMNCRSSCNVVFKGQSLARRPASHALQAKAANELYDQVRRRLLRPPLRSSPALPVGARSTAGRGRPIRRERNPRPPASSTTCITRELVGAVRSGQKILANDPLRPVKTEECLLNTAEHQFRRSRAATGFSRGHPMVDACIIFMCGGGVVLIRALPLRIRLLPRAVSSLHGWGACASERGGGDAVLC